MVETIEVIDFKKLEEVHAQKLKANAQMLPEDHIVLHMNNVHNIIWIVLLQEVEDLKLNACLISILLLVLDYLQSYILL